MFGRIIAPHTAQPRARFYSGPVIENEAAYDAAISRRIRANYRKTNEEKWNAVPGNEEIRRAIYARADEAKGDFWASMYASLQEWGALTDKQTAAVRRILDTETERKAQARAKRAEEGKASRHVGTVGKREVFTATVKAVPSFESMYGRTYINILHDAAGNVLIYKGGKQLAAIGEAVTIKATVKEHGERDGVAQTILARPAAV